MDTPMLFYCASESRDGGDGAEVDVVDWSVGQLRAIWAQPNLRKECTLTENKTQSAYKT